ncbi:hypothetical protein IAQ61_010793 [Plenodomus lingam]|uniref:Predicted protein n=1 Tax=Leptosphaeria maculans (strain JN3 / isolate v23.1.3 / race Av1-4-5-6-7-8) TaxID=985895 RepID=E4ZJ12_LEPMJ|nr:predicted protein [Plenodomus lingam JN3]KAH9861057.1 hypothetical protein IAQ61_010793 [Plenodomus lingam]CBX91443.1 predicted protein [Plenodomus lingam JN3]
MAVCTKPDIALTDLLSGRFATIQENLHQYLNSANLVMLRGTSKRLRAEIDKYCNFNIDARLNVLFKEPKAFRNLQAHCDAIIAGPFASYFFTRASKTHGKRVIVLIFAEQHPLLLHEYLQQEGYSEQAFEMADRLVERYGPRSYVKIGNESVQIRTHYHPRHPGVQDFLQAFVYSTNDMAVITWNKAYHLLPHCTFVKRKSYLLATPSFSLSKMLRRQAMLGLQICSLHLDQFDYDPPYDLQLLTWPRSIRDKYTWIMDLDTTGVTPSKTPDYVLESTTFRIRLPRLSELPRPQFPINHYRLCNFYILHYPVTRHKYIVDFMPGRRNRPSPSDDPKLTLLANRLHDFTVIELLKMDSSLLPSRANDVIMGLMDARDLEDFVQPPNWNFYDHMVEQRLAEIHEQRTSW